VCSCACALLRIYLQLGLFQIVHESIDWKLLAEELLPIHHNYMEKNNSIFNNDNLLKRANLLLHYHEVPENKVKLRHDDPADDNGEKKLKRKHDENDTCGERVERDAEFEHFKFLVKRSIDEYNVSPSLSKLILFLFFLIL
jgi:hypothetical protein